MKSNFIVRLGDIRKETQDGAGDLDTPAFRYSIETAQNPEDPNKYAICRRLELRQGWTSSREAIEQIFGDMFTRLVVEFETAGLEFDQLIETLEDIQEQRGGRVAEDDRKKRALYTTPVGARFTFDLVKGTPRDLLRPLSCLDLVDAARNFQFGLGRHVLFSGAETDWSSARAFSQKIESGFP